jgi:hypothetical protein
VDQSSTDAIAQGEPDGLESGLRGLWDRVKRAGELIAALREENAQLHVRAEQLERELRRVQVELQKKDHALLETEAGRAAGDAVLSNGEREALIVRVRELLTRIEGYL